MANLLHETKRLELIVLDAEDRQDHDSFVNHLLDDDEAFFRHYFGEKVYNPESEEDWQNARDSQYERRYLSLIFHGLTPVFFRQKGQEKIIGHLVLLSDQNEHIRLNYFLNPSFRGQGYCSEAYRGFEEQVTGLIGQEINFAEVAASNGDSLKFLFSQGFKVTKSVSRIDSKNHWAATIRGNDYFVLRR